MHLFLAFGGDDDSVAAPDGTDDTGVDGDSNNGDGNSYGSNDNC